MMKRMVIIGLSLLALISVLFGVMYSQGKTVVGSEDFYMVSHSEYWSGETGQIIARLYDWLGQPIIVNNCTATIYYPNKTFFVNAALTNDALQATTGTHYYTFTTPTTEGVYEYMVTCSYNSKVRSVSSSFHVSPAQNFENVINSGIVNLTAQELAHFGIVQINLSTITGQLTVITQNQGTILINLTSIKDDTSYIRNNMVTQTLFNTNITTVVNNQGTILAKENQILSNLSVIEQFCNTTETINSALCVWVAQIKATVIALNSTVGQYTTILNEINQTTHSTYDYLTGTVTTDLNSIIGITTNINSTTNRIEQNTIQINATINAFSTTLNRIDTTTQEINSTVSGLHNNLTTIITNQQNIDYMDVTS